MTHNIVAANAMTHNIVAVNAMTRNIVTNSADVANTSAASVMTACNFGLLSLRSLGFSVSVLSERRK